MNRIIRRSLATTVVLGAALGISAAVFVSCTPQKPSYTGLDPDRILHMAGEEAGAIDAPYVRLQRQLNIANRENENGHWTDSRATLVEARKTLESAKADDLTDHQRLAGWISLSELNRSANDSAAAGAALDVAIKQLHELLPVNARCDYVHGVAREANALRGKAASAAVLSDAGEWAVEIPDQSQRRSALVSFTIELFRNDDYDAARKMLRYDKDAGWRSDTLIALSDQAKQDASNIREVPASLAANKSQVSFEDASAPSTSVRQQPYGKQLDFRSNYYKAN